MMKNHWISILIVGLTFGTSWAIRGQFGHEQGAAWAGGIGALSLILVSQRKDWYAKMLLIAFSSAIGWGAGGMISYGQVVGYGRSNDLLNASYGLLMLFVIGGLFGLLGGGLTGLTLDSTEKKRVNWSALVSEMAAGGLISYSFLIVQIELLMTPPRSEAWAVCFGAGIAMIWYMVRNDHNSPLRVAFYTALGAGFGFAFGNFLQILGNILEIDFNMWNVMEYSIGFFGGISLAYGVFSSEWPEESSVPERWENKTASLIIFVFIPFLVLSNSPVIEVILRKSGDIQKPDNISLPGSLAAIIIVVAVAVFSWYKTFKNRNSFDRKDVLLLFVLYFVSYICISYCVTGAFKGLFHLNHHLYVVNFIAVLILMAKNFPAFTENPVSGINWKEFIKYTICIIILIIILALIAINIHHDIDGVKSRFTLN
jgi:hypothetical protein